MQTSTPSGPSGDGSGRSLPNSLLICCAIASIFSTLYSFYTINAQLRNYRKPILQRHVVRLLLMVPLYSIASLISLFSLQAAFLIDLTRDLYEAFVIYSFFTLLVEYLGGERSILILLHGRDPINHLWPLNHFLGKLDPSDPFTLLAIKRGVLQYVQLKPILAGLTVILKIAGKYEDGKFATDNGYTYISFLYNLSVFISLYSLGLLWSCLSFDLASFRVTSKFLCIKGIIFFSFWQSLVFSFMVSPLHWITSLGPVQDPDYISLALQDASVCFEMVIFALWHAEAFSWKDYVEKYGGKYQARVPVVYAIRDVIGGKDVWFDSITTIRGKGYDYRLFEPSEGVVHADLARKRRSQAGLRYSAGGESKYWLPQRTTPNNNTIYPSSTKGPISMIRKYINEKRVEQGGYAPLLKDEVDEVVHIDPELIERERERRRLAEQDNEDEAEASHHNHKKGSDYGSVQNGDLERGDEHEHQDSISTKFIIGAKKVLRFWPGSTDYLTAEYLDEDSPASLHFDDPLSEEMNGGTQNQSAKAFDRTASGGDEMETEKLYDLARKVGEHGDYNYPNVDLTKEEMRRKNWEDDQAILDRWKVDGKKGKKTKESKKVKGKGKGKGKERLAEEGLIESDEGGDENESSEEEETRSKIKRNWNAWADEEERLEDEREGGKSPKASKAKGKGKEKAKANSRPTSPTQIRSPISKQETDNPKNSPSAQHLTSGAVDLVIEDFSAEERERVLERRRGDPAMRAGKKTRIFRRIWKDEDGKEREEEVEEEIGEEGKREDLQNLVKETKKSAEKGKEAAEISNSALPNEIDSQGHTAVEGGKEGEVKEGKDSKKEAEGSHSQRKYVEITHERMKNDIEEADQKEEDLEQKQQQEDQDQNQQQVEPSKGGLSSSGADQELKPSSPEKDQTLRGEIETAEVGKERKVAREVKVEEAMKDFGNSNSQVKTEASTGGSNVDGSGKKKRKKGKGKRK